MNAPKTFHIGVALTGGSVPIPPAQGAGPLGNPFIKAINPARLQGFHRALYMGAVLLLLLLLPACGKTGDPRPRQNSRSFAWEEARTLPVSGCLDIYARLSGTYANLGGVALEFSENLTGRQDCTDCPFMPGDRIPLEDMNGIFDFSKGELRSLYCPVPPVSTYRLRLLGFNLFDPSRPVISPEMFVSMP